MVGYMPSLDREGESLGKDAMNMKKITIALFALAMAAVPAGAHQPRAGGVHVLPSRREHDHA